MAWLPCVVKTTEGQEIRSCRGSLWWMGRIADWLGQGQGEMAPATSLASRLAGPLGVCYLARPGWGEFDLEF